MAATSFALCAFLVIALGAVLVCAIPSRPLAPVGNKETNNATGQTLCNSTALNETGCIKQGSKSPSSNEGVLETVKEFVDKNSGVIARALIVFGSITAIVLIYVAFRCIRRRHQQSKTRKYGLISVPDDKLELRPLDDDDDDDEDMTVFDRTKPRSTANSPSRSKLPHNTPLVGKRPR